MKLLILATILFLIPNIALADSEKELIQSHLQLVEEGLRSTDVSHLSPSQRNARKQNLDNLRKYWQAGIFPKNTKHPNQRMPYFIDDGGRACAMAHLLIESGHKEAALQIQLRENNAYVHDIKSPELATWLKTSGLTLDEAAWIQPTYEASRPKCDCECDIGVVNDGTFIFINECIAVRCNQVKPEKVKLGCGTLNKEVVSYRVYELPFSSSDVCLQQRSESSSAMTYEEDWSTETLCKSPATELTGKYNFKEDDGCSATGHPKPNSIPAFLWLIGFGLVCFRRCFRQ